jgi:hypothetical protein
METSASGRLMRRIFTDFLQVGAHGLARGFRLLSFDSFQNPLVVQLAAPGRTFDLK